MRVLKKIFWSFFAVLALSAFCLSSYDVGKAVVSWIPSWLTYFVAGFLFFSLITLVIVVFALGIAKIKEALNG